jgi:hypothetical protein
MTKAYPRQSTPNLSKDQLDFFYGILVFYESDEFSQAKFDIRSTLINKYVYDEKKRPKGIKLLYSRNKGKRDKFKHSLNQMQSTDKKTIAFIDTKGNVCKSLLCHIRNSFAHNRIIRENNDILFLTDEHSGTLSMKGRVKFKVFKELVNEIIKVGINSLNSK